MKKIVSSVLIFMVLLYAMPIITVGMTEQMQGEGFYFEQVSEENDEDNDEERYISNVIGFDEKTIVSVLTDGEVKEMTAKEYLTGVVAAEMPASFPIEALKAQAVAARSYMLYKINNTEDNTHKQSLLCDDYNHCTAFYNIEEKGEELWGADYDKYAEKIKTAVSSTDGVVAMCDGEVIAAVFHSASSDYTEAAVDVWGKNYSYLVSVPSSGGSSAPNYYGTVRMSKNEFISAIKNYYPNIVLGSNISSWFSDINRSSTGSVFSIKIGGILLKGTEVRRIFKLNSTNFTIDISGDDVIFNTTGTGHGVGMSQYGAREMALNGSHFDEIICHYYSGVQLMVKN